MIIKSKPLLLIAALFAAIFLLNSCKKQEVEESTVQFIRPEAGQQIPSHSGLWLEAKITDPTEILMVTWNVIGPAGDTIENSDPSNIETNLGTNYSIKEGVSGNLDMLDGKYTWNLYVANRFHTQTFKRSYQMGN